MNSDKVLEKARKKMIADALRAKGMTQQDLAIQVGRALGTVQNWISGKSIPELTPEETAQLCAAFDCSLEDLAVMFPGRSKRREAIRQSWRKDSPE
jgi:transcriptional regulator with XRE-family HTH domain